MSSWFPVTTTAALLSTPLVVIIFIVGHMAVTAPSVPCPTGCDCSVDEVGLLTAKCSLSSFAVNSSEDVFSIQNLSFNSSDSAGPVSLKDDMFQAFSDVTIINLSNCSVDYIHPAAFRGLKLLEEIDLSNNLITHFHRTSFDSTPKLALLNLNNNPIEVTDLFLSSRSLQELRLESCSIQQIPSGAFKALPKLKTLSLYNNSLETIPPYTIPMGLKRLKVAKNRLVNIPTEVIYSLKRIRILDISENSINCSCGLMGLQDWLSKRGITFEKDVLCMYPPKYRGKSWNTVNEDEVCNKEIKMVKELNNNNVYGESRSVDTECDDVKASCGELDETLQADQPLKEGPENNRENELTPSDEPAGTENAGDSVATDEPDRKSTLEKETSDKESEGNVEEKGTKEEGKSAPEFSQDETAIEEAEKEKPVEESTEQLEAQPEATADSQKEPAAEENIINESKENSDDVPKDETGEAMTVSEVKTDEGSTPSTGDQVAESGAASASETPPHGSDPTPVESTSVSSDESSSVEESAAVASDREAEGRSLDIPATNFSGEEEQGSSTYIPEAKEEVSAASTEVPVESIVESATEAKSEPNEELEDTNLASSTTEGSEPVSAIVIDHWQTAEMPSSEESTEAVTVKNSLDTSYETIFDNPSSSSAAPEEVSTTPLPDLTSSSVYSSVSQETTSSSPELSSSVSPENADVSSTPETNVDATVMYVSSSEEPTSSEASISSSTTESAPVVDIGLDVSSSELPSSPSTPVSPVSVESEVSSEAPSTVDSLSTPIPFLVGVNVNDNGSNLTAATLPDQTHEPIISYNKVMTELKSNPGAYILGCIVLLLAILLLFALSRCRKAPTKKRREEKYDSDMNGGTELQEITSLIPASMSNGTKIYNNKYPSEKPSKDTMNLLSAEKDSNGVVIPLHGDTNGSASNNNTSWSNGTKVNTKGCNGSGKTEGSVASMADRGSQFFDDGVNPPIELTKVKVMMLPDSVPKTPVFVHRNLSDDNS